MKKSLFGFSAKVAMAVLAVCSFVLTGCYEKTPVAKTPSEYYVVGTVYSVDADGNYAKISGATVTVDGKSVSNPFEVKLDGYKSSVVVTASAEGYVQGSRTVAITKLADYNQSSVTNADLVLVKVPVTPEDPEQPEDPSVEIGDITKATGFDADAVAELFAIEGVDGVYSDEKGKVQVYTHYSLDTDLHANRHANFHGNHVNHTNGVTNEPLFVEDSLYVGSIFSFEETEELYGEILTLFAMIDLNTTFAGTVYADFQKEGNSVPYAIVLNRDGSLCVAGFCICREFTLWSLPFSVDGVEMNVMALQSNATIVSPITADIHDNHDNHDNHDIHDNHDNHHNNHTNHGGATAWGGGAGDAE